MKNYSAKDKSASLFKTWKTVKHKYSDAIILLKDAETYITFEKDAALLQKLIPIKLKPYSKFYLQYAFKCKRLDNVLHKLATYGYKVAVCDPL